MLRAPLLRTGTILLLTLFATEALAARVSTRRTRTVLAVERAKDAVVGIVTDQVVKSSVPDALDEAFDRFLRESETVELQHTTAGRSLGSGVVIDPAGFILTSYRIVARGSRMRVVLGQGREYVARVIGTDPDSDIAVLKVDAPNPLPFAVMGTSNDLMIGETAIAIGNPFGDSRSVAVGIVSATGRAIRVSGRTYYDLIQTDANVHAGNAGGPVINGDGEIMGIAAALTSGGRTGYAVPIERAKRIALELIKNSGAPQAYLGFDVATVNADISRFLGVQTAHGACIVSLENKSPAEFAGLKVGDVITRVGDNAVFDAQNLVHLLREVEVGKQAVLEVHRGTDRRTVPVVAAAFPLERAEALFARKLGAAITEVKGDEAKRLDMNIESAVKVRVVMRGSLAERAGLAPGDIIRAVNSFEVNRLPDFRQAVSRARRSGVATLLIQRGFQLEQIPIDFY